MEIRQEIKFPITQIELVEFIFFLKKKIFTDRIQRDMLEVCILILLAIKVLLTIWMDYCVEIKLD